MMQKRVIGASVGSRTRESMLKQNGILLANARSIFSFGAQEMSDQDLLMYCKNHRIDIDCKSSNRRKMLDAVENHKLHNLMGPSRALLSEQLEPSYSNRWTSRIRKNKIDSKSIKDQANAVHVMIREKKRGNRAKHTHNTLQLACVLPMEVVMVTANETTICLTTEDGNYKILNKNGYTQSNFRDIALDGLSFLRKTKPNRSYAMFACDSATLLFDFLQALGHGNHSDVEFTFNLPLFHRQMHAYHKNLFIASVTSDARTIASQLGVSCLRTLHTGKHTEEELELLYAGKDFHAVLRLFQEKLNPFGSGSGSEIDCLLTRSWGIVLYQFEPRARYSPGKVTEMTCSVLLVEENISQTFVGGTKQQIIKSIADWLKRLSQGFSRYVIVYQDTIDAKLLTGAAARLKLKCDMIEIRQFVPKTLLRKLKSADIYSPIWKPINLWKNWQQAVINEYGSQLSPLRAIRRYLVSQIMYRKIVHHHIGRNLTQPEEKNEALTTPVAHIRVDEKDFILPEWYSFRTDVGRAEREHACAEGYKNLTLIHTTKNSDSESLVIKCNDSEVRIFKLTESIELNELLKSDCLVSFDAKELLQKLWDRKEIHDFIARGGKVWCISYAGYMINGRDISFSDKVLETAGKFLNDTKLAPSKKTELLREIFLWQKRKAICSRQFIMISALMGAVIMVNELRHSKIYFDYARITAARQQVLDDSLELREHLKHLVPDSLQRHFQWGNLQHLRILFLGGRVTPMGSPSKALTYTVPDDPSVAIRLAASSENLSDAVTEKYASAYALKNGLDTMNPAVISEMKKKVEQAAREGRPIHLLIAAFHATGLNCLEDHIVELALYNPMNGKVHNGDFSKQSDYLILSTNSMLHGEPFIRKHLENLGVDTKSVYYGDLGQIFSYARAKQPGKQVFLKNTVLYKESTMHRHMLDAAVDLWRDLLVVSDGNAKRFIGRLVGTAYDPFLTAKYDSAEPEALPGIISYKNKLANSKLSQMGNGKSIDELLHHEGTNESRNLLELIKLTRILESTYLSKSGMGHFVQENFISPKLSFSETRTGRFTAKAPNILGVPKSYELRKLFASRFGSAGYILEIDYSMLEICTMAVLCGDPNMIRDMSANIDYHTRNLVALYPGYTYEELNHKIKVENDKKLVKLRERAKIFSFQRLYGASQRVIVESSGLSEAQVTSLIRDERRRYPRMDQFRKEFEAVVHRLVPSIQTSQKITSHSACYTGEGVIPTGGTFRFTQTPMFEGPRFGPTLLKNYPVQGLAAEIASVMASKLAILLKQRAYFDNKAFLVNFIHDSFVFDVHESVFTECLSIFHDVLQNVNLTFQQMYPEMHWKSTKFHVKASYGRTWGNQRPIQPEDIRKTSS